MSPTTLTPGSVDGPLQVAEASPVSNRVDRRAVWSRTALGRLCGERAKSVEPAKTPEKEFELYSVPSFPAKKPEIVLGKDVGSNKQLVETRSVLLCKINPRINRAWVVGDFTSHTKIASTEWIVFPPSDEIAPEFLCYFLQQNAVRDFLAHNASGVGGSLMRVKPSTLRDFPFSYPEIGEQRRIVAESEKQFTRLETGVTALRRVQANLKRYRAAVLKAACEGRLVPTEAKLAKAENRNFETGEELLARMLTERRQNWRGRGKYKEPAAPNAANLASLPAGWTWASAEQITSLVTSGSRGWGEYYSEAGPLFIRAQDIKTDSLKLNGVARVALPENAEGMRSSVENGDLLITITGANVTKSAIVQGLSEIAFVSQHVALLKPICRAAAAFTFLWIVSPAQGRKFLEQWAYGAGKPGLSLEQVRCLPIALPPLAEQTRIVGEVERRLSVVEELEATFSANLQRVTGLRQSILHGAFASAYWR